MWRLLWKTLCEVSTRSDKENNIRNIVECTGHARKGSIIRCGGTTSYILNSISNLHKRFTSVQIIFVKHSAHFFAMSKLPQSEILVILEWVLP